MTDSQKWLVLSGVLLTGWLVYLLAPDGNCRGLSQ
jgi:hypothetical protein